MSSRSLSRPQREKLQQFCSVTSAPQKIAIDALQASDWRVDAAVDYYYSSGMSAAAERATQRLDKNAIKAVFEKYKDPNANAIMVDGIVSLCSDLGVEPEDVVVLVLSWHMNASSMGEYSREEFEQGMVRLGCDSLDKLKAKLPTLRSELQDSTKFREIYGYGYLFGREKGQKCVQLDMALGLWQLLLPPERWPLIEDWCEFLQKHHGRAVSRDTWTQLLDFVNNIKTDFSNYDETGAWPYLLDEFVEYMRKKRGGR